MSAPHSIHDRLFTTQPPVPRAQLTEVVQAACQTFHRVVGASLGVKYQRAPVYLVDDWVTDALGLFSKKSRVHRLEQIGPDDVLGVREVVGFGPIVALFDALGRVEALLGQGRLLALDDFVGALSSACLALVAREATADHALGLLSDLRFTLRHVFELLKQDSLASAHLNGGYVAELEGAAEALAQAIERCEGIELGSIPGVSFEEGRRSGLLLANIPELRIEGPAILVAPGRIAEWTADWPEFPSLGSAHDRERWPDGAGGWRRETDAFLVALGNVVQHELTHAMIRLASVPAPRRADVAGEQNRLYEVAMPIEEGLANFVAHVCTVSALAAREATPKGFGGGFGSYARELSLAANRLHEKYYEDATESYLTAWREHDHDLIAFSSYVKLFATNTRIVDWEHTFGQLHRGEIVTGRGSRISRRA